MLATLVGLICNWRQERGGQATERFQDFMTWLSNHHFEGLRERIFESEELQRELSGLLQRDVSDVNAKLDVLTNAMASVAEKLDSFRGIGRAIGAVGDQISHQAVHLLCAFEASGAARMVVMCDFHICYLLPNNQTLEPAEKRFLEDDISSLAYLGFLKHVDYNKSGHPIYAMTRAGSKFAQEIQAKSPSPPQDG